MEGTHAECEAMPAKPLRHGRRRNGSRVEAASPVVMGISDKPTDGNSIGQDSSLSLASSMPDALSHQLPFGSQLVAPMYLFNGPNTPFGRLALATALELGLQVENRVIDVYAANFLDVLNPLRQIPTLVLGDDRALFDSRVICMYFGSLRPEVEFVALADWVVQTRWSLATGLMEASVARTMELRRQASEPNMAAIARHDQRIERAIAALEAQAAEICAESARIDRLATAVALEYIDFRAVSDWRGTAPRLARWLENETTRPSLASTRPYDLTPDATRGDRQPPPPRLPGSALP